MEFPEKEWRWDLSRFTKGERENEESVLHASHMHSSKLISTTARGWVGKAERRESHFFIHLTDVVLKYCRGRRGVGGGRSREGDRLELMVLMSSLNVAICCKVVRTGTAFS